MFCGYHWSIGCFWPRRVCYIKRRILVTEYEVHTKWPFLHLLVCSLSNYCDKCWGGQTIASSTTLLVQWFKSWAQSYLCSLFFECPPFGAPASYQVASCMLPQRLLSSYMWPSGSDGIEGGRAVGFPLFWGNPLGIFVDAYVRVHKAFLGVFKVASHLVQTAVEEIYLKLSTFSSPRSRFLLERLPRRLDCQAHA